MISPVGAASPLVQWISNETVRVSERVKGIWTPAKEPVVDTIESCKNDRGPAPLFSEGKLYFFNSLFSIGSGVCGMMVALDQIKAISLTLTPKMVIGLGNVFFTIANLVNFYDNMWRLVDAERHIRNGDEEAERAALLRRSALLGLLSSGSYLVMGILSVAGAMSVVAAVFGGVAVVAAGVQWAHDYFLISSPEKEKKEILSKKVETEAPLNEWEERVRHSHLTTSKI